MADHALKDRQDVAIWNALEVNNLKQALKLVDKRLAKKRTDHLEAFKIYIQSRSPLPTEKAAVLLLIQEFVEEKKGVSVLEDIDLYDDALDNVLPRSRESWTRLIGELRWQSVKAFPKNEDLCLGCFRACLMHDDWEHSQQIASTLEKSFPSEHKYVFWNITALFQRSLSKDLPLIKASIWGRLALGQISKLASATKQAQGSIPLPVRAIQTPQELLLLHKITAMHGKVEERLDYFKNPFLGPKSTVAKGEWELWRQKLSLLTETKRWEELFNLSKSLLERARLSDESGHIIEPRMADWTVWDAYLTSASALQFPRWLDEASIEVQAHLDSSSGIDKAWRRNASLAWLRIIFMDSSKAFGPDKSLNRSSQESAKKLVVPIKVAAISQYYRHFGDAATAYSDLREYVEQLDLYERKMLLRILKTTSEGCKLDAVRENNKSKALPLGQNMTTANGIARRTNAYKLAYLLKSSLAEHERRSSPMEKTAGFPFICHWCSKPCSVHCYDCLTSLAYDAVSAYKTVIEDDGQISKNLLPLDRHPADDFIMIAAMCLIKLSGASLKGPKETIADPRVAYLLQSTILLEFAEARSTNFQMSLMLVRLYSFLGCGSLAQGVYQSLGIKQIQWDTLSYVLFDRISSFHPHPFPQSPDDSSKKRGPIEFLQKQQQVYRSARKQASQSCWTAFEHGNYNSIFEFKEFSDTISQTISAATSIIESKRISRISKEEANGVYEVLPPNPEYLETFADTNDYETFPNFECNKSHTFEHLYQVGPKPSALRCHLNLITEYFISILDVGTELTMQKTAEISSFKSSLHPIFKNLLQQVKISSDTELTRPEKLAAESYNIMAEILSDACDVECWSDSSFPSDLKKNNSLLCERLDECTELLKSAQELTPASWNTLHSLYTAYDLVYTALKLNNFLSKGKSKQEVHESQAEYSEALSEHSKTLLNAVKEKSIDLKLRVDESGWIDGIIDSVMHHGHSSKGHSGDIIESVAVPLGKLIDDNFLEKWAGEVVESWRESVEGLGLLKDL